MIDPENKENIDPSIAYYLEEQHQYVYLPLFNHGISALFNYSNTNNSSTSNVIMTSIFDSLSEAPSATWFKFETIGTEVQGLFQSISIKPADGQFQAQLIVLLKREDGSLVNVPLRKSTYNENALRNPQEDEPMKFRFDSVIPSQRKGFKDTKVIKIYRAPANTI